MTIGNVNIPFPVALAPMAGVCDLSFRQICRELGAEMTYTEMVSAKALYFGDEKTKTLLKISPDEHPCAAQIFGSDITCMGAAAKMAQEISGADIIDINMGCPVGKIIKSGDGSALMRDPDKARQIIETVCENTSLPVTVKIRKGWDSGSVNAVEFAQMAQEAGAAAITVHGRTRVQMYSGLADRNIIRDVKKAVTIPVIANGDIFSAQDAVKMLNYTGADMVMVGRGAFGNPWIFAQIRAVLSGQPEPEPPTIEERVDTAVRQFELSAAQKGERVACLQARKHFCWYLHGIPHAAQFKTRAAKIETLSDIYSIASDMKKKLR